MAHFPPWHRLEQHSALALQSSPFTVQSFVDVHFPPKQPRPQQSCALVQATPSALHASVHFVTPA